MTNDAHRQFHREFMEKLQASEAAGKMLSAQIAEYEQALQQEEMYYRLPGKSVLTGKINRACSLCGGVYSAMKAIVSYKRRMAVTDAQRDAAALMENFMKTYGITRVKRYIRRLSLFKSMADDILEHYGKEMELLGIGEEVAHLKRLTTDMQAYIADRTAERQGIPLRAMQKARHRVDACYREIVGCINAYAFLSKEESKLRDVIEFSNAQIRRYKHVELNRPATTENKNDNTADTDNGESTDNQAKGSSTLPDISNDNTDNKDNIYNINSQAKGLSSLSSLSEYVNGNIDNPDNRERDGRSPLALSAFSCRGTKGSCKVP